MEKLKKTKFFKKELIIWYHDNPRPLPWKGIEDPYKIWVSEIILQQTRVAQGLSYYHRFIERFPTIQSLASSPIGNLLKVWEGLGYYSRARNMHITAQNIVNNYDGKFPPEFEELIKLKGIGEYTAAAISSFAFNKSHPVIDGNVIRVLCRIFGIKSEIQKTSTKRELKSLAKMCIVKDNPAEYNQAIMNFGALHCAMKNPACLQCVMKSICIAYKEDLVNQIPYKKAKAKKKVRVFHYFVIHSKNEVVLRQRREKDIWEMLYDFPIIEKENISEQDVINIVTEIVDQKIKSVNAANTVQLTQVLSHQKIVACFYKIKLDGAIIKNALNGQYKFVNLKKLKNFAFPKIIDCYLKENSIYLEK